jgi:hypothetical protein
MRGILVPKPRVLRRAGLMGSHNAVIHIGAGLLGKSRERSPTEHQQLDIAVFANMIISFRSAIGEALFRRDMDCAPNRPHAPVASATKSRILSST